MALYSVFLISTLSGSIDQNDTLRGVLDTDTVAEIAQRVRSGFYDRDEILYQFSDEMTGESTLDPDEVGHEIDAASARLTEERRGWPRVTDCDRLTRAFEALNARGIIALENAGNTQSDGYEDFEAAFADHVEPASVIGFCFYHWQDVERALDGGGLYLAFGPSDPAKEQTDGPVIGTLVREELERAGLEVRWDGKFATRMFMPKIVWQKR